MDLLHELGDRGGMGPGLVRVAGADLGAQHSIGREHAPGGRLSVDGPACYPCVVLNTGSS